MNKGPRIIFMGSPKIAVEYLQEIIKNNFNVISVYTMPPRPKGRGMKIQNSPVHNEAMQNNIPVYHPINFDDSEIINIFENSNPDLVIVMAYGMILPKRILNFPKYGCINIHLSLLPKWRGASPVEHALLNNEKKTGITIFKLIEKLDAGPIISQSSLIVQNNFNKEMLFNELNELGKNLIIKTLPKYFNNIINLQVQKENETSYANKITSNNTKIDFFKSSIEIYNLIRAFSPKPGAWFFFQNERFKIIECKTKKCETESSKIINAKLHIGCKDGIIIPTIVQREGKNPMKIDEFLRGFKFKIGQKINA